MHTWKQTCANTAMQIQPTGLNINTETKQIEAPCLAWVLCMSGRERGYFVEPKQLGHIRGAPVIQVCLTLLTKS